MRAARDADDCATRLLYTRGEIARDHDSALFARIRTRGSDSLSVRVIRDVYAS